MAEPNTMLQRRSEDVNPGAHSHKIEESLVNRASCGAGVDIYGIDTGIYAAHTCFGGRAHWGATFGGYANQDGNGHGTHTVGIAAGNPYGVAWLANLVAVKGAYSDIISAVNFVCNSAQSSGHPSIVLMSLGWSANTALDSAVAQCIQNGVHFVNSAGNSNIDASSTSPARVAAANTVGAVDSSYRKASFSNYGTVLDV
ncbi:cuticle-degrading protease [Ceratobasidium sp. AG-Ba]|nr:cuticle-degrading protease [Ceratobasidium sp. AG-Ba]